MHLFWIFGFLDFGFWFLVFPVRKGINFCFLKKFLDGSLLIVSVMKMGSNQTFEGILGNLRQDFDDIFEWLNSSRGSSKVVVILRQMALVWLWVCNHVHRVSQMFSGGHLIQSRNENQL